MTEILRDDFQWHTSAQEQRGCRVTQLMKVPVTEAILGGNGLERL
jgi:hypothetical protein